METSHGGREQQHNNAYADNTILLRDTETGQIVRGRILETNPVAAVPRSSNSSHGTHQVRVAPTNTAQGTHYALQAMQSVRMAQPSSIRSTTQGTQQVRAPPPSTSQGIQPVTVATPSTIPPQEGQPSCSVSYSGNGGVKPRWHGTPISAMNPTSQAESMGTKGATGQAGASKPAPRALSIVNQEMMKAARNAHAELRSPSRNIKVTPAATGAVSPSSPQHPITPMKRKRGDQASAVQSPNRLSSLAGRTDAKRAMVEKGRKRALSCAICLEKFKTPKVLTCGHTYCLRCIDKIVNRGGPKLTLLCPTCRMDVTLPESGKMAGLPTNYQLASIIGDEEPDVVSDEDEDSVEKLPRRCRVHRQDNKLYCRTCSEPVCLVCIQTVHKLNEHDLVLEEVYVAKQIEDVEGLAKKLLPLEEKLQTIQQTMTASKEAHNQQGEQVREQIREKCTERKRQLDGQRDDLLREVDEYMGNQNTKLSDMKSLVLTSQVALNKGKAEIQSTMERVRAMGVSGKINTNQIAGEIKELIDDLKASESVFDTITSGLELKFVASKDEGGVGAVYILKK